MAAAFCGRRPEASRAPRLANALSVQLPGVGDIYPGTKICCVINSSADVLAQFSTSEVAFDEVTAVVGALKQAAIQFGNAAGGMDCPVIHIKGMNHIFSCFDIGQSGNLLAFYSEMHPTSVELFDTSMADIEMVGIIDSLGRVLERQKAGA